MPHLVEELFRLAGRDPHQHFQYQRLDLACRYQYEDGTILQAWADPERFANEVETKLGVPSVKLKKHLAAAGQKFRLTKGLFLERSLHRMGTYLSSDTLRALTGLGRLDLGRSMHAANARALAHPKL
ncbi:MAG: hypothetical protein U0176_11735 [Bacteroidia bacterium]